MNIPRLVAISCLVGLALLRPALSQDITTGLVGQWAFDAGSGTTAADSTGHNLTGTLVGSPAWSPGKVGPFALTLNGTSQYVRVPNAPLLTPTRALTVAAWFNVANVTKNCRPINKTNPGVIVSYHLELRSTGKLRCTIGTGQQLETAASWPVGSWHHLACTWDGSTIRGYFDGVLDANRGSFTGTVPDSGVPLYLGAQYDASLTAAGFCPAQMDEVRLYDRALSAGDIQALVAYQGAVQIPPPTDFRLLSGTTP